MFIDESTGTICSEDLYKNAIPYFQISHTTLTCLLLSNNVLLLSGIGHCLTFWYNMYGTNIGTLNVIHDAGNGGNTVFTENGNKGQQWLFASVNLPALAVDSTVS